MYFTGFLASGRLIPSSYKNENLFSFLIGKKITTIRPTYLVCYSDLSIDKAFISFYEPKQNYDNKLNIKVHAKNIDQKDDYFAYEKNMEIVIKINCGVSFYIDDIIGYCDNEGGIYIFHYYLTFLNDINKSDVEIIKIKNDIKADNFFNKLYDYESNSFKAINLSKNVILNNDFFTDVINNENQIIESIDKYNMLYKIEYEVKNVNDKLKYLLEKCSGNQKYVIKALSNNDIKNWHNFNRLLNYESAKSAKTQDKYKKKKKNPLLTFLTIFVILLFVYFIIKK